VGHEHHLVTGASAGGGLEPAAQRVEQERGPVDVWVNGAMTMIFARTAHPDSAQLWLTTHKGLLAAGTVATAAAAGAAAAVARARR
jgi:hypothetical protein